MTSRIQRLLTGATALVLISAAVGCGLIDKVKDIADAAGVLAEFSSRLEKAKTLTYTAEYTVTGTNADTETTTVTLVQQPPNSALLGKEGRYIFTEQFSYLCSTTDGALTCQKSKSTPGVMTGDNANAIATAAGAGFVTPEIALGLVAAAAFVPGANVSQSTKTIAGQSSLCADVTGLENVPGATPGDQTALHDFSVCVTDEGALASFNGALQNGEKAGVELTSYADTADASAFSPPEGAKIVDMTAQTS